MDAPTTAREAEALALWKAAEADFAEEKRHTAFIIFCRQTGQLPLAGRMYAARAAAAPDDPAVARYREMVVAQAIAALGVPQRPAGPIGFFVRHKRTILVALGVASLLFGLIIMRKVVAISGVVGKALE
jgi:hypothetical protein